MRMRMLAKKSVKMNVLAVGTIFVAKVNAVASLDSLTSMDALMDAWIACCYFFVSNLYSHHLVRRAL
jgi:hypothetical protein